LLRLIVMLWVKMSTGVKYTNPYTLCATQEYMLHAGTLYKAFSTIVICIVAMSIVVYRRPPSNTYRFLTYGACFVTASIAITLSIYFKSARLFCNVDIPSFSDASPTTQRSIIAYYACFSLLIQLCALIDIIIFIYIMYRLHMTSSDLFDSSTNTGNSEIIIFVKRLSLYPMIFFLGWFPDMVTLFFILNTGKEARGGRIFVNICAGSTGLAASISYFYFQIPKSEKQLIGYFVRGKTGDSAIRLTEMGDSNAFTEPDWSESGQERAFTASVSSAASKESFLFNNYKNKLSSL
jgi:hypothetical protein